MTRSEYRAKWKGNQAYLDGRPLPCGCHTSAWDSFQEVYRTERQHAQTLPKRTEPESDPFSGGYDFADNELREPLDL